MNNISLFSLDYTTSPASLQTLSGAPRTFSSAPPTPLAQGSIRRPDDVDRFTRIAAVEFGEEGGGGQQRARMNRIVVFGVICGMFDNIGERGDMMV